MLNDIKKIFINFKILWKILEKKRRSQIVFLQLTYLVCAFFEFLNLLVIKYYIDILLDNKDYKSLISLNPIFEKISENHILLFFGISTIAIILVTSLLRVFTIYFQHRMAALLSLDIGTKVYKNVINQSYTWHKENNTSKVLSVLSNDVDKIRESITSVLALIVNSIIVFFISLPLLFIEPKLVISLLFIVIILFAFINKSTSISLKSQGLKITNSYQEGLKLISESLGSIKDILINNRQFFFLNNYIDKFKTYNFAHSRVLTQYQTPRFIVEGLIVSIVIIISLYVNLLKNNDIVNLSILGTILIGLYRILVPFQQCSVSISLIYANSASWKKVKPFLSNEKNFLKNTFINEEKNQNNFEKKFPLIKFDNVSFKYPGSSKFILKNFNLIIKEGQKIGFIGYSGSGKTTCADLIAGLLKPNNGTIFIKGEDMHTSKFLLRKWHKIISYVPQNIFLLEDNIIYNIAFGLKDNEINKKKVIESCKKASLHKTVLQFNNGYEEIIGEFGKRLSGGQLQRLAIARAFYKEASCIIFDEATNALDKKTEGDIIKSLNSQEEKITLLFITHRLSTIKNCDFLVFFQKQKKPIIGKYSEIIKNKEFKLFLDSEKILQK